MTAQERPRLDLRQPRDVGGLISTGFGVYFQNFGVLLVLAAAVVIPVELIVSGIGLGELTAHYDSSPSYAATLVPTLTQALVVTPLITAMSLFVLMDLAEGKRPRVASTGQRGLDVFAPVLYVVVMVSLGVFLGFFAFVVGAIYIAIRWLFAPAAVVVEGKRGTEALRRSSELVRGSWWRCFGVMLVTYLAVGVPIGILQQLFTFAADAANAQALVLAGRAIGGTLGAPLLALIAGLLYFDQRLRHEYGGTPPVYYQAPPPPPPPVVRGPEAPPELPERPERPR